MSLSTVDSVRLAAVLEDSVDQLIILGHLMNTRASRGANTGAQGAEEREMVSKLRRDWQYILKQMCSVQMELKEQQTFSVLLQAVEEAEERKAKRLDIINRNEMDRERLQILLKQKNQRPESTPKVPDLDRLRVSLEDQLKDQEAELKTERQKVKNNVEMQIQQTEHQTRLAEILLKDQLKLLQEKLMQDERVHEEIQTFLFSQHKDLQQEQQKWLQCSQQIRQLKLQQLDVLRSNKLTTQERLYELSRKYRAAEQLVIEHRDQKEKLRRQQQKEQKEERAATMVQAWWRGCMVRRGLGPFAKGKKAKKGKKKQKKGK